jgi:flavin reductase (DIM6/NTAB) family NADH-FMN oxidoreductase RutF
MNKSAIQTFELWPETMEALTRAGLLLNTADTTGKANTMTIGWLTGGVIWSRPVLIVLVRPSRFTYSRLEQVPEFTVNVLPPASAAALEHCGTVSGRDHDKFAETGLTLAPAQKVRVPVIKQAVVNYECRVVHRNDVIPANLADEIKARAYQTGDFHRVYFGEVLAAYAVREAREELRRGAR